MTTGGREQHDQAGQAHFSAETGTKGALSATNRQTGSISEQRKGQQPGRRGGDTSGCCRMTVSARRVPFSSRLKSAAYGCALKRCVAHLKFGFRNRNGRCRKQRTCPCREILAQSGWFLYCATLDVGHEPGARSLFQCYDSPHQIAVFQLLAALIFRTSCDTAAGCWPRAGWRQQHARPTRNRPRRLSPPPLPQRRW